MPNYYLVVRPENDSGNNSSITLHCGDKDNRIIRVSDLKSVFNIITSLNNSRFAMMKGISSDPAVVKARNDLKSGEMDFTSDDWWRENREKEKALKRTIFNLVLLKNSAGCGTRNAADPKQ